MRLRSNGRLPEDDKHERCEENRPLINRNEHENEIINLVNAFSLLDSQKRKEEDEERCMMKL